MNEDMIAEMQMALVRICRKERTVKAVWNSMQLLFPQFPLSEIKEAVKPAIERMMNALGD